MMLILASQSQTRKALLEQAGLVFTTAPASIDERGLETGVIEAGGDGRDVALLLAQSLARSSYTSYVHYKSRIPQLTGANHDVGLLRLLWLPSLPPHARKPPRRDNSLINRPYRPLNQTS